jgi:hypothetical protein
MVPSQLPVTSNAQRIMIGEFKMIARTWPRWVSICIKLLRCVTYSLPCSSSTVAAVASNLLILSMAMTACADDMRREAKFWDEEASDSE